jgi:peptide/nickel transport system permease protein
MTGQSLLPAVGGPGKERRFLGIYIDGRTRCVIRRFFTRPTALVGIALVSFFIVIAIAAPLLAPPADPGHPLIIPHAGYRVEPQPPGAGHPFGTTERQYDVYYGVIWGTRTAFRVGLVITFSTLAIGILFGSLAAYYGGLLDHILMRIVEIVQAFPFLLAALTLASILSIRIEAGIVAGMIALIAFGWPQYARLIRGDILAVRERDYVQAARALGAGDMRILIRHIIPNAIFPTLVIASMDIGSYVLSFAALSFLGLGAEPGYADWGQMIGCARNWIPSLAVYPHILLYPGLAIFLFGLGWNLIGDAFRDVVDPRLVGSR